MSDITLYGAIASPYVRKVRLCLDYKKIPYKQINVIPMGDDQPAEFKANSPLGKIPLMLVGDSWLLDSSVMCDWLEREHGELALLPKDHLAAARALWFEEYADTHMVSIIGGHLFAEVVLAKAIFKREPIQADIDAAIEVEIPAIFDYLEGELSDDYLVGNRLSLADISVCGVFVTMHHCQYSCDAVRWPKVAAYIDRVHGSEFFQRAIAEEKQFLVALAS